LFYLRVVIFCALLLLLALGGWLAVMVYREMVAPLQVKLVESAAIIERQEKLASLGMLAAGVAHEIRNPLTAIKARLFTQQRRLKTGTPEFEDAHLIGQEISRLERIVKEILEFARPSDPHLEKVNAGAILRDVQTLLGPPLEKRQIAIHIDGDTDLTLVADQQQLKQVLINLVQNAADSIGERGSVRLSVKALDGGLPGHGGDAAVLEVRDTGKGIAPEVEKRLFDPFFTTKEHGTGLGLPLAARIVEKHGGQLRYQTQLNKGTTFGVVLPRAREP
jgi:signal transduction histidine kinase